MTPIELERFAAGQDARLDRNLRLARSGFEVHNNPDRLARDEAAARAEHARAMADPDAHIAAVHDRRDRRMARRGVVRDGEGGWREAGEGE